MLVDETSQEFLQAISDLPEEIRRILRRKHTVYIMNKSPQPPPQKWCGDCVHFTGKECVIFTLKRHSDTTACIINYSTNVNDRQPGTQLALF